MRKTVLSFLNYLACIGMALFVTLMIEGTIGMVLTYALVIALLVSLLMTLGVLRRIRVQAELSKSAVSKGDSLVCEIKLLNRSLLPTPLIVVAIDKSAHFSQEDEGTLQGAVSGRGINTLRFPLKALHAGKARIQVKSIRLTDYLGIFSFKLPCENPRLAAAVYPNIPDISILPHLLKTASLFSDREDEEESSADTSLTPTGFAGYDHREYMAGDPIKRINWKLSSKRDILMVRLDEILRGAGRNFLLDCPETREDEAALTVRDNIFEGALAILRSLLTDGRPASFFYFKQGMWMSLDMHLPQDVYALQEELSDLEPAEAFLPLPSDVTESSKTLICFTTSLEGCSSSAEYIVSHYPDTMMIASHAASLPLITPNQWFLSDSFELNRV